MTWDLYAWNNPSDDEYEFFCCLQGLQGVYSKEKSTYGFFGCFNETDVDDDTMGALEIRVTGKSKLAHRHLVGLFQVPTVN